MARREFETLTPQMFYILLALYDPLYALLPRFENEGYIKLVKEENKRKVYLITNNGKRKLESEKERMQKQIILFMKRDYEDEI